NRLWILGSVQPSNRIKTQQIPHLTTWHFRNFISQEGCSKPYLGDREKGTVFRQAATATLLSQMY
ncbi:mCG145537, partial [Mus musculus]